MSSRPPSSTPQSSSPVPIASLTPAHPSDPSHFVRGVVTLLWPYSSSTQKIAFLLSEPDFRLRVRQGQVRVQARGPSAKVLAENKIGIGDELELSLDGVRWVEREGVTTPGRTVDMEMAFGGRMAVKLSREDGSRMEIRVDEPWDPRIARISDGEVATPVQRVSFGMGSTEEFPRRNYTPVFHKQARLSAAPELNSPYNPFVDDGNSVDERERKRIRRSWGEGVKWMQEGQQRAATLTDKRKDIWHLDDAEMEPDATPSRKGVLSERDTTPMERRRNSSSAERETRELRNMRYTQEMADLVSGDTEEDTGAANSPHTSPLRPYRDSILEEHAFHPTSPERPTLNVSQKMGHRGSWLSQSNIFSGEDVGEIGEIGHQLTDLSNSQDQRQHPSVPISLPAQSQLIPDATITPADPNSSLERSPPPPEFRIPELPTLQTTGLSAVSHSQAPRTPEIEPQQSATLPLPSPFPGENLSNPFDAVRPTLRKQKSKSTFEAPLPSPLLVVPDSTFHFSFGQNAPAPAAGEAQNKTPRHQEGQQSTVEAHPPVKDSSVSQVGPVESSGKQIQDQNQHQQSSQQDIEIGLQMIAETVESINEPTERLSNANNSSTSDRQSSMEAHSGFIRANSTGINDTLHRTACLESLRSHNEDHRPMSSIREDSVNEEYQREAEVSEARNHYPVVSLLSDNEESEEDPDGALTPVGDGSDLLEELSEDREADWENSVISYDGEADGEDADGDSLSIDDSNEFTEDRPASNRSAVSYSAGDDDSEKALSESHNGNSRYSSIDSFNGPSHIQASSDPQNDGDIDKKSGHSPLANTPQVDESAMLGTVPSTNHIVYQGPSYLSHLYWQRHEARTTQGRNDGVQRQREIGPSSDLHALDKSDQTKVTTMDLMNLGSENVDAEEVVEPQDAQLDTDNASNSEQVEEGINPFENNIDVDKLGQIERNVLNLDLFPQTTPHPHGILEEDCETWRDGEYKETRRIALQSLRLAEDETPLTESPEHPEDDDEEDGGNPVENVVEGFDDEGGISVESVVEEFDDEGGISVESVVEEFDDEGGNSVESVVEGFDDEGDWSRLPSEPYAEPKSTDPAFTEIDAGLAFGANMVEPEELEMGTSDLPQDESIKPRFSNDYLNQSEDRPSENLHLHSKLAQNFTPATTTKSSQPPKSASINTTIAQTSMQISDKSSPITPLSEESTSRDLITASQHSPHTEKAQTSKTVPFPRSEERRRPAVLLIQDALARDLRARSLRTSLSYYVPLTNLPTHLNPTSVWDSAVDVLALVSAPTSRPRRAERGDRDWFTRCSVSQEVFPSSSSPPPTGSTETRPSAGGGGGEDAHPPRPRVAVPVQVFRPFKTALPVAEKGDVMLLRGFVVVGLTGGGVGLVSGEGSAWAVWREGRKMEVNGPPVDVGQEEVAEVEWLRKWWEGWGGKDIGREERIRGEREADEELYGKG